MGNWVSDAQKLNNLNLELVEKNRDISDFLKPNNFDKHIIVSSKGMGKTLLLRHKREQVEESRQGFLIIPKDEQSDYVELPSFPNKDIRKSLEDQRFWEDLWKTSIIISLIMSYEINLDEEESEDLLETIYDCELPSDIEILFDRKFSKPGRVINKRPSKILDVFLTSTVSEIEKYRNKSISKLSEMYLDHIQSACAVFIDSLDQALNKSYPGELEIWCAAQAGLLKAAWELSRHNKHVKVFVTVRQEAFSWFTDPEINNIKGSVLLIKYDFKSLRKIFEYSIINFDGKYSIEQFF